MVSYCEITCDKGIIYITFEINYSVIQLAKLSGFSPIITTASLKHAESLKSLGATHVIDRNISGSALASEIVRITQNEPLKYAVDSISLADTQQAAYDLLAPGGKLAVFLPVTAKTTEEKDIISAIGVIKYPSNVELLNALFHYKLEQLLKEGVIKVRAINQSVICQCFSANADRSDDISQTEWKYYRTVFLEFLMG